MLELAGGCARIRTLDPLIKSQQLLSSCAHPAGPRDRPRNTRPAGLHATLTAEGLGRVGPRPPYAAIPVNGLNSPCRPYHPCRRHPPPTRITATPPASFARRSWSFSLS